MRKKALEEEGIRIDEIKVRIERISLANPSTVITLSDSGIFYYCRPSARLMIIFACFIYSLFNIISTRNQTSPHKEGTVVIESFSSIQQTIHNCSPSINLKLYTPIRQLSCQLSQFSDFYGRNTADSLRDITKEVLTTEGEKIILSGYISDPFKGEFHPSKVH